MVEEQDFIYSLKTSVITIYSKAHDRAAHISNNNKGNNFPHKHFPVRPMKLVRYWSSGPNVTIRET